MSSNGRGNVETDVPSPSAFLLLFACLGKVFKAETICSCKSTISFKAFVWSAVAGGEGGFGYYSYLALDSTEKYKTKYYMYFVS